MQIRKDNATDMLQVVTPIIGSPSYRYPLYAGDLIKTVKNYEAQGVTLVAISNDDRPGQREAVKSFLGAFPELTPYAALGEPSIGASFDVKALPSVYVIDRDGHMSASFQAKSAP